MSNEERKYVPAEEVISGVQRTVNLLNYMLGERAQLYGTIIYLMQSLEKDKVYMPSIEAMQEYHDTFSVNYALEDDGFVVKLLPRDDPSEEKDGEEGS
jgi:hypothetical protein